MRGPELPVSRVQGQAVIRLYRRYLAWLMDEACERTNHALLCYNEPRWVNRVWFWALTGDDSARVEETRSHFGYQIPLPATMPPP